MTRWHVSLLLAGLACALLTAPARAQDDDEDFSGSVNMGVGPTGMDIRFNVNEGGKKKPGQASIEVKTTAHEEITSSKPGETFKLTYDGQASGKSQFKILAPEGLGVRVTDGGREVVRDTVPAAFDSIPGHFYRVEIFTSDAVLFDKKFEAKPGMLAQLWVSVGAPPPPQRVDVSINMQATPPPQPVPAMAPAPPPQPAMRACMDGGDFASVKGSIEDESFSNQKLQVLESAIAHRDICGAQVIEVLGLFDFSNDKLQALRLMKPHIVDPQNNFKIYGAFTFDNDKRQAKQILGN